MFIGKDQKELPDFRVSSVLFLRCFYRFKLSFVPEMLEITAKYGTARWVSPLFCSLNSKHSSSTLYVEIGVKHLNYEKCCEMFFLQTNPESPLTTTKVKLELSGKVNILGTTFITFKLSKQSDQVTMKNNPSY